MDKEIATEGMASEKDGEEKAAVVIALAASKEILSVVSPVVLPPSRQLRGPMVQAFLDEPIVSPLPSYSPNFPAFCS